MSVGNNVSPTLFDKFPFRSATSLEIEVLYMDFLSGSRRY